MCDLECRGLGKPIKRHEYVGDVRLVLVNAPPGEYTRRIWVAAIYMLSVLLLGTTFFTIFYFTLSLRVPFMLNIHVFACTVGFQLLMPSGIMLFSSIFGGSMYLKPESRKFQHFVVELCAAVFFILGAISTFKEFKMTLHAVLGLFGMHLTLFTGILGPFAYAISRSNPHGARSKTLHKTMAVITLIICFFCFVTGLLSKSFRDWTPAFLPILLSIFTLFNILTALSSMVIRRVYST